MARTVPSPFAELTRLISWHRRKLAVLAAMAAAATAINAATPDPPPTISVVVAGHRLAGGIEISAADLAVRDVPEAVVPPDAVTDPERLIGRTLVAPLSQGSVLTELSVLGGRPVVAEDKSLAPLRIADESVVGLLRIGDLVDVVGSDPESGTAAEVIAEDVRVVTIPRSSADSSGLDPGTVEEMTLLLVEVTPEQATRLADAAVTSQLSVLLG